MPKPIMQARSHIDGEGDKFASVHHSSFGGVSWLRTAAISDTGDSATSINIYLTPEQWRELAIAALAAADASEGKQVPSGEFMTTAEVQAWQKKNFDATNKLGD